MSYLRDTLRLTAEGRGLRVACEEAPEPQADRAGYNRPNSFNKAGIPSFSSLVRGLIGLDTVSLSRTPMIFNADFIPEKLAALGPPPLAKL